MYFLFSPLNQNHSDLSLCLEYMRYSMHVYLTSKCSNQLTTQSINENKWTCPVKYIFSVAIESIYFIVSSPPKGQHFYP